MVVREGEIKSQGEVEREEEEVNKNHHHPLSSSLGRQSSIYSLTLDEFQHSLCDNSGKNFGSMNMDEFLSSIWNAEENQAINNSSSNNPLNITHNHKGIITKQPSLPRQSSLSIPAPLCRKTVDEVWSEIHREQQQRQQQNNNNNNNNVVQNTGSAPRQPTFGEMTLEDFLVNAGVVREPIAPVSHQQQQQHYGVYPNNNTSMAPSYVIGGGGYQAMAQGGGGVGETSGYAGNGKRDGGGGYPPPPPAGVCFGGGGYGVAPTMGMGVPVSPASSDGLGNDNCGGQFGRRKRMGDGPVEKVVERRQRRMIKNRESAARSRARKQAYTVELEAELNQLREENAQLKQELAELERRRRQQCLEEVNVRGQTKAQKAKEKLRALRRNLSCTL